MKIWDEDGKRNMRLFPQDEPPSFFLTWSDMAIAYALEHAGFDLTRPVEKALNRPLANMPATITFTQKIEAAREPK